MKIYKNAKLDKSIKLDWDKSFYLWGKVGIGKTHNAYALVIETNTYLRNRQDNDETANLFYDYPFMTFVNFADICDRLRNAPIEADIFAEDSRSGLEYKMLHKKRLIIDDIAAEKRSDYSNDFLMRLVEYRYSNNLYTGFTSNLAIGKLPYEARIVSRIAGIVGNNKFEIKGKDLRLTQ